MIFGVIEACPKKMALIGMQRWNWHPNVLKHRELGLQKNGSWFCRLAQEMFGSQMLGFEPKKVVSSQQSKFVQHAWFRGDRAREWFRA